MLYSVLQIIFAGLGLPPEGRRVMAELSAVGDSDVSFMDLDSGAGFNKVFEHFHVDVMAVVRQQQGQTQRVTIAQL